jgi:hypothetical protein
MSERHDRMNIVDTDNRGDGIIVAVVVTGLTLIGAFFLFGGHTGGTLVNADLAGVAAPATQRPVQ